MNEEVSHIRFVDDGVVCRHIVHAENGGAAKCGAGRFHLQ
jgi:hypothetical protein